MKERIIILSRNLALAVKMRELTKRSIYKAMVFIRNDPMETLSIAEKGESILMVDADILESYPEFLGTIQTSPALIGVPILVIHNRDSELLTRTELERLLPGRLFLTTPLEEGEVLEMLNQI